MPNCQDFRTVDRLVWNSDGMFSSRGKPKRFGEKPGEVLVRPP